MNIWQALHCWFQVLGNLWFEGKDGAEMEWIFLEYPVVFDTSLLVLLEVVVELQCRSLGAEIKIWELPDCESCWSSHILWVNLYQKYALDLLLGSLAVRSVGSRTNWDLKLALREQILPTPELS